MHLKCCHRWSNSGWTQQNVPCETWHWKVDIQASADLRAGNIIIQSVMLPCCMPSWQNVRSSLCTRFRIIPRQAFRSRPLETDPWTSNKFSKLSTLPQGLLGKLVCMRPRIKATDPDLIAQFDFLATLYPKNLGNKLWAATDPRFPNNLPKATQQGPKYWTEIVIIATLWSSCISCIRLNISRASTILVNTCT